MSSIVTDSRYRDYLAILKGFRNGLIYGIKIRFPHALIMSILFGRGDWKTRGRQIFQATKQHALSLAGFVSLYKTLLLIQRKLNGGKERRGDTFFAGMIGGYIIFGDRTAINEQIVLYVCSRVVASFLPRAGKSGSTAGSSPGDSGRVRPIPPDARIFSLFAAMTWGAVMWLFKYRGETIQPGMFSSMRYLYQDSDHWDSLRTLLWQNK